MNGRATPDDDQDSAGRLEELLRLSGTGDAGAFGELYDRLAPRVFGLVTCLLRTPGAAERISCDAFLEVWRCAPTYDPARSGAVAWVLSVVRRIAVPESRLVARAVAPSPTHPAPAAFLLSAGLTRMQTDALHRAWFEGRDHRSIEAELRPGEPVAAMLTGALRAMAQGAAR